MSKSHSKKVSRSLVALSSAAVLAVYTAGFIRTKAAADRFLDEPVRRRPVAPIAMVGDVAAPPAVPTAPLTPLPLSSVSGEPPSTADRRAAGSPAPAAPVEALRVASSDLKVETTEKKISAEPAALPAPAPSPLAALASAAPTVLAAAPQALGALPSLLAPPPMAKYKDGTFTGWGTCRHGDIQAKVVIAEGKITSASVAQCLTRYSCSWIAPIVPQVVVRQSPETDFVSGATDSTNAFYYAVVEALSLAKNK
jgi:uncharacterized protein with FMN-binding domain